MRVIYLLLALTVVASPSPTPAQDAGHRLGATIRRALADRGEIVTAADHRAIAAKCSLPRDAAPSKNVSFTNGALLCPDGRVVRDGETRAMADRIAARAKAKVAAVMKQPQVIAAVEAVADGASLRALRELRQDRR